jgi:hypothetical protein
VSGRLIPKSFIWLFGGGILSFVSNYVQSPPTKQSITTHIVTLIKSFLPIL